MEQKRTIYFLPECGRKGGICFNYYVNKPAMLITRTGNLLEECANLNIELKKNKFVDIF